MWVSTFGKLWQTDIDDFAIYIDRNLLISPQVYSFISSPIWTLKQQDATNIHCTSWNLCFSHLVRLKGTSASWRTSKIGNWMITAFLSGTGGGGSIRCKSTWLLGKDWLTGIARDYNYELGLRWARLPCKKCAQLNPAQQHIKASKSSLIWPFNYLLFSHWCLLFSLTFFLDFMINWIRGRVLLSRVVVCYYCCFQDRWASKLVDCFQSNAIASSHFESSERTQNLGYELKSSNKTIIIIKHYRKLMKSFDSTIRSIEEKERKKKA